MGDARRDATDELAAGPQGPHRMDEPGTRAAVTVDSGQSAPHDAMGDLDETGEVGTLRHVNTVDTQLWLYN